MEKILLVDDEADALEVLEWVLTDLGCHVRTARAGEEALDVGQWFRPTVLITDYCLTGDVTGVDVIRTLRDEDPSLRAILMTGMMGEELHHELRTLGDIPVVRKPFSWDDIRELLQLRDGASAAATAP